jgi:hypothetical protein
MAERYTHVVVLCEDRQQEVFARHFLMGMGIERNRIRYRIAPSGKGAGEQYVRKAFTEEVRVYREKSNHLNIALAVMVDADILGVEERLQQLENILMDQEKPMEKRGARERIGIFIPKRNIETWIHYLLGESVNEEESYPKFTKNEGNCIPAVKTLANACKKGISLRDEAPHSLKIACNELARILQ